MLILAVNNVTGSEIINKSIINSHFHIPYVVVNRHPISNHFILIPVCTSIQPWKELAC